MIEILIIEVKVHSEGEQKWKGLDMIIYMSNKNENICIPILLIICLYVAVGNNLVNKSAKLLENLICFTFISYPDSP